MEYSPPLPWLDCGNSFYSSDVYSIFKMKTYHRFVNTSEGELPVVGDEVFCPGGYKGKKWAQVDDQDLAYFQATSNFCDRVFRRELHPHEMAKEIASDINQHFFMTSKLMVPPELKIESVILPHIQAALEGKS